MTLTTPRLLSPRTWGAQNNWSYEKSYRLFRDLPENLKVKIGGRLYVNESALSAWLSSGGQLNQRAQ